MERYWKEERIVSVFYRCRFFVFLLPLSYATGCKDSLLRSAARLRCSREKKSWVFSTLRQLSQLFSPSALALSASNLCSFGLYTASKPIKIRIDLLSSLPAPALAHPLHLASLERHGYHSCAILSYPAAPCVNARDPLRPPHRTHHQDHLQGRRRFLLPRAQASSTRGSQESVADVLENVGDLLPDHLRGESALSSIALPQLTTTEFRTQSLDAAELKKVSHGSFSAFFLPRHALQVHSARFGPHRFPTDLIASLPNLTRLALPSIESLVLDSYEYRHWSSSARNRVSYTVKTALIEDLGQILPNLTHLELTGHSPYSLFGILGRSNNLENLKIDGLSRAWIDWDVDYDPARFREYLIGLEQRKCTHKLRVFRLARVGASTFSKIFSFLPPNTVSFISSLYLDEVKNASRVIEAVAATLQTLVISGDTTTLKAKRKGESTLVLSSSPLPFLRHLILEDFSTLPDIPLLTNCPSLAYLSLLSLDSKALRSSADASSTLISLLESLPVLARFHLALAPVSSSSSSGGRVVPALPLPTPLADALIAHCALSDIFLDAEKVLPTKWQRRDERLRTALGRLVRKMRDVVKAEDEEGMGRIEELLGRVVAVTEEEGEGGGWREGVEKVTSGVGEEEEEEEEDTDSDEEDSDEEDSDESDEGW